MYIITIKISFDLNSSFIQYLPLTFCGLHVMFWHSSWQTYSHLTLHVSGTSNSSRWGPICAQKESKLPESGLHPKMLVTCWLMMSYIKWMLVDRRLGNEIFGPIQVPHNTAIWFHMHMQRRKDCTIWNCPCPDNHLQYMPLTVDTPYHCPCTYLYFVYWSYPQQGALSRFEALPRIQDKLHKYTYRGWIDIHVICKFISVCMRVCITVEAEHLMGTWDLCPQSNQRTTQQGEHPTNRVSPKAQGPLPCM